MITNKITIHDEDYYLIKDYKDNDKYRQSLNRLTSKTFGFDFEDWYQQGYWGDKYRPYSLLHNDEIVANVSANPIDFLADGKRIPTIQIGTVITEESYRHRGLSRVLIELVLKEYESACDLMYLYANNTVLEFYPKYGFEPAEEHIYTMAANQSINKIHFRKLLLSENGDRAIITRLAANTKPVSRYQMIGNPELKFFYLTSYMSDYIYYSEELDLAAVVEYGDDNMTLIDVFCEKEFELKEVINSLVSKDKIKVTLGFTPLDTSSFDCEYYKDEGLTFFVKGNNMIDKGRFPLLSHA